MLSDYRKAIGFILIFQSFHASAIYISEDFTGNKTNNNWLMPNVGNGSLNTACLTAGNSDFRPSGVVAGSPPRCLGAGSVDYKGNGALRLTTAENQKAGGIVSNFTFPSSDGVEIAFTTYTYGGNGADGMSFMLIDGSYPVTLGATGGSLGYSCSASGTQGGGVAGGYLGIGIDEYGNFTNYGDNSQDGIGSNPGFIGLRGAGVVHKEWLALKYPRVSWTTDRVRDVCRTTRLPKPYNNERVMAYPYIAGSKLDTKKYPMYNRNDKKRSNAKPISYKIKITPNGLLSVWWSWNGGSFQPILTDSKITDKNGPLPKDFRFAFAGSTGGSNNIHEVTCFKAAPSSKSEGSAEVNLPDARFIDDTQLYLATYNPLYWTGQVTAQSLIKNKNGTIDISKEANWDASCVLDGGICANTGGKFIQKQSMNDRKFVTWNGNRGIDLAWDSLTNNQKNHISQDSIEGKRIIDYLKGNSSYEIDPSNNLRLRKSILGDIVNSSPMWVGQPKSLIHITHDKIWQDRLHASDKAVENRPGSESYASYAKKNANQLNVVYIGGNDGFLHGFRSGSYDGNKFNSKNNDGNEVLAFMPASVLSRIKQTDNGLNFVNPQYSHNFYVDGTVGTGDVFYGDKWHKWLLGGLGAGGASVYALDITNPDNFKKDSPEKIVKGEWSYDSTSEVWKHLGNTYGQPQFGRFHNGQWGAVFGNGWCTNLDAKNGNCKNINAEAGIYVMTLDSSTGKPTFNFLSTGTKGDSNNPNGIAYVTPIDSDDDGIIDYLYAGDVLGNIWRFDLTSNKVDEWKKIPKKIFQTPNNQPISTKVLVTPFKKFGMMLNFGTGKRQEGYLLEETKFSVSTQSIYGVLDVDVIQDKAISMNARPSEQVELKHLQKQTIVNDKLSTNTVDWNKQKGWYVTLTDNQAVSSNKVYEQILYNANIQEGILFVNSFINGNNSVVSCTNTESSGYTYAFDYTSGAGVDVFNKKKQEPARYEFGATGSPLIMSVGNKWVLINKTISGETNVKELYFNRPPKAVKRLSWRIIS